MKKIAIVNQKGGVGKTTTSINLSAGLARKGKRVLLIDLDPQANSTSGLGVDRENIKGSLFDVITGDCDVLDSIKETTAEGVDILPSSIQLAGADIYLTKNKKANNNELFTDIFKPFARKYDYIIMDCPPSLGTINRNALTYADAVIVPIQTEYFALEGLTQLLSTMAYIKKEINPKLKIDGILLTMFDKRTNLSSEVKKEIKKFFKDKLYKTEIYRNVKVAEAPSAGLSIYDYDNSSVGAKCYMKFTEEFIKQQEK